MINFHHRGQDSPSARRHRHQHVSSAQSDGFFNFRVAIDLVGTQPGVIVGQDLQSVAGSREILLQLFQQS